MRWIVPARQRKAGCGEMGEPFRPGTVLAVECTHTIGNERNATCGKSTLAIGRAERMKAVLLAGGLGTRLSEETSVRPKPMVEIGGRPILWHIMKIYAAHGIHDFVVCAGYKSHMITEYFASYGMRHANVTFDLRRGTTELHGTAVEPWRVTIVDTGESSMTGGRLRRVKEFLDHETFCLTYGDGVADIDITALLALHRREGRLATLTATQPEGRFGALKMAVGATRVSRFKEKPNGDGAWINGGFFVCEPQVLDYIDSDATVWEEEPLQRLVADGQLSAYKHTGFWQPMDTLRDKDRLERLWHSGSPPWRVW
jgi:glucose-1-phosphate cytidylyltransferase